MHFAYFIGFSCVIQYHLFLLIWQDSLVSLLRKAPQPLGDILARIPKEMAKVRDIVAAVGNYSYIS